jgi:hypothetical protein
VDEDRHNAAVDIARAFRAWAYGTRVVRVVKVRIVDDDFERTNTLQVAPTAP